MGEMADFYIDQMMDAYPEWGSPYGPHRPHHRRRSTPSKVACSRCGEDGLAWFDTGVRWRLVDAAGNFHVCGNDNAVDDFEVLE